MSNEGGVPSPSSWLADEGLPRPPPGDNHCKIDWVGCTFVKLALVSVVNGSRRLVVVESQGDLEQKMNSGLQSRLVDQTT